MEYNHDNISLLLAQRLSDRVNAVWQSGEMLENVTPITRQLLQHWFCDPFTTERSANFHQGQRQAILNTIYLHEVAAIETVADGYSELLPDDLGHVDTATLAQEKYRLPKYAIKMATGTGKTWVMHALMLWQMLNARHTRTDRYTQKFLLIAPGLIVYDRLMDAYLGKIENGVRQVESSDLHRFQALFIPPQYREEVFNFVHINTVGKEQGIGRKATGDGLIAITNWHLFLSKDDEVEELDLDYKNLQDILLPSRPGVAAGNALDTLDRRYLRGSETEFLQGLPDLMIINDEAHHVHENGKNADDVQWQQAIDYILSNKRCRIQVDFSATPYEQRGSGRKQRKIYFPHIVVDFGLKDAMHHGLVKTLALDQRQNYTELEELDHSAIRDGRTAIALSDGQKLMLRAGLQRLNQLQHDFGKKKYPKMMVVCEDTSVTPLVEQYLIAEGLKPDEVLRVDSDAKGNVKDEVWRQVKERLSSMDGHATPRVVISVMMLREGFDVNNICVVVPLRSADSSILLEQMVGRGLRLMWREPEYQEAKAENRQRLLVEKRDPLNLFDMLFVVDHPRFRDFYNDLINDNLMAADSDLDSASAMGDMITAELKEGYERYDIVWLNILRESEEVFAVSELDVNQLHVFEAFELEQLKKHLANSDETFVSKELITGTSFGKFKVKADLFNSESYREYLQKMLSTITRQSQEKPFLQVGGAMLMQALDVYIRTRLFGQEFDPFEDNNWKILLAKNGVVTQHIVKEMAILLYEIQQGVETTSAEIVRTKFSSVPRMDMRERLSQEFVKTIYTRTAFASNGGGLERAFMEFIDNDGEVERWIKISETRHPFARIAYMRDDGLLASYIPDFLVQLGNRVYMIETKADNQLQATNVQRKRRAAAEWCQRVSQASGQVWEYIIVGESLFYSLTRNGATFVDLCEQCKFSSAMAQGRLSF